MILVPYCAANVPNHRSVQRAVIDRVALDTTPGLIGSRPGLAGVATKQGTHIGRLTPCRLHTGDVS